MKYRQIRKVDTGQWLNVLFTVDGPEFSVKPESHQAAIAGALGVSLAMLEVMDANMDLRTGVLLNIPLPSAHPLTSEQQSWAAATVVQKLSILAKRLGLEP